MSKYVPLSELPNLERASDELRAGNFTPLAWEFSIPPTVDSERLQLNMHALKRYQKIGAIGASVVVDYQGDTTEHTPGISGINPDGSAIATRAGVTKKAERSKNKIVDPPDFPKYSLSNYGYPTTLHQLNRAEIGQQVAHRIRGKEAPREELYADELDKSLRESFRSVAKEHLVERTTKSRRLKDYLSYAGFIPLATLSFQDPSLPKIAFFSGVTSLRSVLHGVLIYMESLNMKFDTGNAQLESRRWSIFANGHQTDRYLALNGLSRVSKLITARK